MRGGGRSWRARAGWPTGAIAAAVVMAGIFVGPSASAQLRPDLGVVVRADLPPQVAVGQTDVPGTLVVESTSLFPVVVTAISLNPECDDAPAARECTPSGAIGLSATATGSGDACPASTFRIIGGDPDGRSVLVPSSPVVLLPLANVSPSRCTIRYTFDVIRAGADLEIHPSATLTGFVVPAIVGTATSSSTVAVNRATVAMTTAAAGTASLGDPIRASALITPPAVGPRTPGPTGTVTFALFRPNDASCAGQPVHGPIDLALGTEPVVAPSFQPLTAGTYRWTVEYSGDANYGAVSSPCSATRTSVLAPPSPSVPTTQASAPTVTVSPPTGAPPTVPAAGPRVEPVPSVGIAEYEPAAHVRDVVALQVSAFALLAILGTAAIGEGVAAGSGGGAEGEGARRAGKLLFTGIRTAAAGLGEHRGLPDAMRGDRSWTWRWPGTRAMDRASLGVPPRLSPTSPLLARIVNDAGYLRAMLGSGSLLLPVLGGVLGAMAVADVGGEAMPPAFALAVALAVVGVLDALAGVIGVVVFVGGVVLAGGLSSADAARTLLGLATMWFAAPLIAGVARPLRRPPTMTALEHWDRTADVVIASLVGAWAVQKIVAGLPGLSGLDLPIAARADAAALIVLAALAVRMALETSAAHWYPRRLAEVQPDTLRDPGLGQRVAANLLVLTIFLFVAVSYLGSCWQLYVGAALFIIPRFMRIFVESFPNSTRVYALTPKGIVSTVLLLVVGAVLGAIVVANLSDGQEAIRNSFVILSLPGFVLELLRMFGRTGPAREVGWGHQLLGIPVLVVGVLLVIGVITI